MKSPDKLDRLQRVVSTISAKKSITSEASFKEEEKKPELKKPKKQGQGAADSEGQSNEEKKSKEPELDMSPQGLEAADEAAMMEQMRATNQIAE